MNRLSDLWVHIEKYVIYILGIIFTLTPFLVNLYGLKRDQGYELISLGLLILFVFRYIDKNINLQRQSDILPVTQFTAGLGKVLKEKKIKRLCIFAQSGDYYFRAIQEAKPQVKELHLLVRNFDDLAKVGFPTDEVVKREYKMLCDQRLKSWVNLQSEENIEKIIIRRYPFDSILHFMLIDNSHAHFGLLKPLKVDPGSTVLHSFIVSDDSKSGKELISNFLVEFDTIFESFSSEYQK